MNCFYNLHCTENRILCEREKKKIREKESHAYNKISRALASSRGGPRRPNMQRNKNIKKIMRREEGHPHDPKYRKAKSIFLFTKNDPPTRPSCVVLQG